MLNYIKEHKTLSIVSAVILFCIIYMGMTGTITYPYIMLSRQIDLLHYCEFSDNKFGTKDFELNFTAPEGYCLIPNRVFPENALIQVLPQGLYSVLNEYIFGTIVKDSRTSIYLESNKPERNVKTILNTLGGGGFLSEAQQSDTINKNGMEAHIMRNVKGIDGPARFDWALISHPNKKYFIMVLLPHDNGDSTIFDYIVDNISVKK